MRKRYIVSAIGAVSMGTAVGYIFRNEKSRFRLGSRINRIKQLVRRGKNKHASLFENTGIPDQVKSKEPEQMENANMVSEGSQYGVHYYNQVQEEKRDISYPN